MADEDDLPDDLDNLPPQVLDTLPTPAPAARPARTPRAAKASEASNDVARSKTDDYVTIVLEENEQIPPTGQFVGLNGMSYLIKPGVPVKVPRGVIDILDAAVMAVPAVDPQTQQVVGYRERFRFPYRVVSR